MRAFQYTAIDDATRIAQRIYDKHTQANAIDFFDACECLTTVGLRLRVADDVDGLPQPLEHIDALAPAPVSVPRWRQW